MEHLKDKHRQNRDRIKQRLREFSRVHEAADEEIFAELCFCLLTPQSKAVICARAVEQLKMEKLLLKGSARKIRPHLKGVRFPNNKARYLIEARKSFRNNSGLNIKSRLDKNDVFATRDWLVRNIKGLGYKEASHFLRNIGLGNNMAILDVHILKNLKEYRVITEIPPSISRKTYLDIESKMRQFSKKVGIPLRELDLLFWSNQTGFVFK